jgi:crotonobetainyl-CoA:carnitine CoA-transferase CaiB-like acyl-CoA transferase
VTGRGDHLDLALHELAAQTLDPVFGTVGTAHPHGGMANTERGRPADISYPVFPCADGYVRLAILAPRQWHSMRAWLGEPDELQDPALDSIFERKARLNELTPHYAGLFSTTGKLELAREGQSRGIPIAPVLAPAEVLTSDHFAARGAFVAVDIAPGVVAAVARA